MQGKKKARISPFVILGGVAVLIILLAWGIVSLVSSANRGISVRPVQLPALSSQQVTPFGDSVLYYDGTTLHCVSSSGNHRWSYQIGVNAGFHAQNNRIAAWSANQLYILDDKGQPQYNDRMASEIQFARTGQTYIAAFVGEADNGTVYVLDKEGRQVDSMAVTNETLLDIGFFASPTELMWVMGLNTDGTVPSVTLQTYSPGRQNTGNTTLGEQLVYKILYYDGQLRVVDTWKIRTFDYTIKEDITKDPILIYGWYLQDVRTVGRDVVELLVPTPQIDGQLRATDLRLLTSSSDRVLHLPAECFSAALGSKYVYGFSASYVYAAKYGEYAFSAHAMPVQATRMLGMLDGDKALIASGQSVYVVQLPR